MMCDPRTPLSQSQKFAVPNLLNFFQFYYLSLHYEWLHILLICLLILCIYPEWDQSAWESVFRSSTWFSFHLHPGYRLGSLTQGCLSIPAVSLLLKIEADDWELPALLCLLYLRHWLIIMTLPEASLHFSISSGVPKRMRTNIGSTFPNKGLCGEVLWTGRSSVIRVSEESLSTSLLLYLNPLSHTEDKKGVWDCFQPP